MLVKMAFKKRKDRQPLLLKMVAIMITSMVLVSPLVMSLVR